MNENKKRKKKKKKNNQARVKRQYLYVVREYLFDIHFWNVYFLVSTDTLILALASLAAFSSSVPFHHFAIYNLRLPSRFHMPVQHNQRYKRTTRTNIGSAPKSHIRVVAKHWNKFIDNSYEIVILLQHTFIFIVNCAFWLFSTLNCDKSNKMTTHSVALLHAISFTRFINLRSLTLYPLLLSVSIPLSLSQCVCRAQSTSPVLTNRRHTHKTFSI